jgi:hypothetical protein
MSSFLSYLKKTSPGTFNYLGGSGKPGSSGFDKAWKALAAKDPKGFEQIQHNFIKQSHYDPAANKVKSATGLNVNSYSLALQNALWSIATQHGAGGAQNIFKAAGVKQGMKEADIIKKIYAERMKVDKYFSRSSSAIKQSVYNRFQNELKDALAMLQSYNTHSNKQKRIGY